MLRLHYFVCPSITEGQRKWQILGRYIQALRSLETPWSSVTESVWTTTTQGLVPSCVINIHEQARHV